MLKDANVILVPDRRVCIVQREHVQDVSKWYSDVYDLRQLDFEFDAWLNRNYLKVKLTTHQND